nr:hypothetical protein [Tanacetum cinerariifolium]
MTIQSSIKDKILAAQNEASEVVNAPTEMLRGLDEQMERRSDGALYYLDRIWVPYGPSGLLQQTEILEWKWERIAVDFVTKFPRTSSGHDSIWVIMDRLTKSAYFLPMREDYKMDRLARLYLNEIVARHSVPISIISNHDVEVGEGQLIRPEIVQETNEKISQIKDSLKAACDRQKSYANKRTKPLEFSVGDHVLLKVSSWKGVVRFEKKGKLAPRFVGPFEITKRIGPIPLKEIQVDAKLNFVEEPVEILEREIKKLKLSRIPIVKARWNSKQGSEFTLEREDQMKLK